MSLISIASFFLLALLGLNDVECFGGKVSEDLNLPTQFLNINPLAYPSNLQSSLQASEPEPSGSDDVTNTDDDNFSEAWFYIVHFNTGNCSGYTQRVQAIGPAICHYNTNSNMSFQVLTDLSSSDCAYVKEYYSTSDCSGDAVSRSSVVYPNGVANNCKVLGESYSLIYYCQADKTTPSQYLHYPYTAEVQSVGNECDPDMLLGEGWTLLDVCIPDQNNGSSFKQVSSNKSYYTILSYENDKKCDTDPIPTSYDNIVPLEQCYSAYNVSQYNILVSGSDSSDNKLSAGAITGIVIATTVVFVALYTAVVTKHWYLVPDSYQAN